MSKAKVEIQRILNEQGFILERQDNHYVYKQPWAGGKMFSMAKTPSDFRNDLNSLRDLKRLLGLAGHAANVGERREKKRKQLSPAMRNLNFTAIEARVSRPTLQDQLEKAKETLTFESVVVEETSITGRIETVSPPQFIRPQWRPDEATVPVKVSSDVFEQINKATAEKKIIVVIDETTGMVNFVRPWTVNQ
jgi:hypothetical protein